MLNYKFNTIVKSFLSLSVANIISTLATMGQGMILVRALSKVDYGTYAQTNLILTITNTIIGLGLAASLNYFIPKSLDENEKRRYANNIFSLIFVMGIVGLIGILLAKDILVSYFENHYINSLIFFIALRPLFSSVLSALINLFVANRLAGVVATRNIVMSLISLVTLGIISITTHNVAYVIICLLVLDILQCLFLYFYYKKVFGPISFLKLELPIIKKIFSYSIPLAFSAVVGTLIIQMDRLIIGRLFSTEKFAEYAIVSTPLPFTIIATAIVTVVRPYITKSYSEGDKNSLKLLWSSSIELSAIITWTLGFAIILVSPELVTFLYTKEYLGGLMVFNIYILFSMISITYYGMILSASGKSKYILLYACFTLILNVILNYLFYWLFGYIGPAIASVVSQILINLFQLKHSSIILNCHIREIFNVAILLKYITVMILVFCMMLIIKNYVNDIINLHEIIMIVLFGGIYCVLLGGMHLKKIKLLLINLKE